MNVDERIYDPINNYGNSDTYEPMKKLDNQPLNNLKRPQVDVKGDLGTNLTTNLSNAKQNTLDYLSSKTAIIGGLILVLLLCILVAWGLYVFISYSIFNQSKIVIDETKIPVLCNTANKFNITTFNKTGNGKRRSFTFWIYINDLNMHSGQYRHVMHIGENDDIKKASPYIFLDKTENKLFIRFSAIKNDTFTKSKTSVQNLTDSELNEFMQQGIVLPYVPIQRWVHIAVVVNENSNGGSIVGYVDGDISKIVTTGEINANGSVIKITNMDLDKMGDLYVGGSFDGLVGVGFSGLISKVTMFNYDLNDKDVYDNYNEGPLNGLLSSLGLSNYGVRSPIYKIV